MDQIRRLLMVRRWGEDEGRVALAAWRASGLPLQTFAHEQGLCPQRLRAWRGRLGEVPALLPVRVVDRGASASTAVGSVMEVVLATGRRVRLMPDFDDDAVGRLVRVLEEGAC